MATIKSCTDLSQSKTLSKILPLVSADMYYSHEFVNSAGDYHKLNIASEGYFDDEEILGSDIPCWSLTALLKYLSEIKPQVYTPVLFPSEGKWILQFAEYGHGNVCETTSENPIDACVALIEKLNELKNMKKYKSGTPRAVKTNRYLINKAKKNIQGIKEHYND